MRNRGHFLKRIRNRLQQMPCGPMTSSRGGNSRCRGCGARAAETPCAGCQRLVDQLRLDSRIAAVFIFNQGKKTRYYAALRGSTP